MADPQSLGPRWTTQADHQLLLKFHALTEEFVQKARAEQAAKREKEGIKEEKVKVEVKKEEKEEKADAKGWGVEG